MREDPIARIAALERALQRQEESTNELKKLIMDRTRELAQANDRLRRQAWLLGSSSVISLLAQHGTLQRAAPHILKTIGEELHWEVVHLLMLDPATQTFRRRVQWRAPSTKAPETLTQATFGRNVGLPGQVWSSAKPAWSTSVADGPLRTACAFPIIVDGAVHAIIEMMSAELRKLDDELLAALGGLGSQIGAVIEQTNARDQVRVGELQVARHIQTAILPRDLTVEGLEVAAMMVPAAEVGGDYYDVLPFSGGAWFGIGDVTGHGVGAGMIMLMVQSAVAALTVDPDTSSPAYIVERLNTFLYDNVHRRLRETDHVTFSLLRYTRDGHIRYAGAHEDLIVWRAKTRSCEVVEASGVWLGAIPSVTELTTEEEIHLAPGDILVLYTDGVIEARNASRELFGFERLCNLVSDLAKSGCSAAQLSDAVIGQVLRWCSKQDDDISIVVARYHGDEVEYEIDSDETVLSKGAL